MTIIHVEMLDTALTGPGLNPDCGHCVVLFKQDTSLTVPLSNHKWETKVVETLLENDTFDIEALVLF